MADGDDESEREVVRFGRKLVLEYDGAFWSGDLKLRGLAKLVDADGILVEIEALDGELSATVRAGLEWLLANEAGVAAAVLAGLDKGYLEVRRKALMAGFEDTELPRTLAGRALAKHVDLRSLTVHDVANGRRPYLGFGFGCTWDDEHGLGMLMHGTKVVQIGGADTAILSWIAERHAKQQGPKRKKRSKRNKRDR